MPKRPTPPTPAPPQEIEAKFSVSDAQLLDSLRQAPEPIPGAVLGPGQTVTATDTYYDTPDFAFMRAGYALRLRTMAERADDPAIVTIKGLGSLPRAVSAVAVHARFEVEGPVIPGKPAAQMAAWPSAVRKKAKEITGGRPALHPVLILTQVRTKRSVRMAGHDLEARPLAELSVDGVSVFDPKGLGAPKVGDFSEIELELQQSGEDALTDLATLAETLAVRPGLTPVGQSKSAQGLLLISTHPAGSAEPALGMRPAQSMAEAGRVVWRHELMKMLLAEAGVRRGEEMEYVHDMRVATRRARAALAMFGPYYQAKTLDDYAKRLRKTARLLGGVRDMDVALAGLDRAMRGKSEKQMAGSQDLRTQWAKERETAQADLLRWFDSQKYQRFIADFAAFCTHAQVGAFNFTQQPGMPPVPHQVRHVLPGALWERFEQVRAYEILFTEDEDTEIPDDTLHKLRIDGKALRYNLDFAQHLLGAEGQILLKQLKQMQNHLGDLNDAVGKAASLEVMRQAGADSPFLAHYIDVQMERAERLRRTFPAFWERFNKLETRARLARALARI